MFTLVEVGECVTEDKLDLMHHTQHVHQGLCHVMAG